MTFYQMKWDNYDGQKDLIDIYMTKMKYVHAWISNVYMASV